MTIVDDQKMQSMYLQKVEQFSQFDPKTTSSGEKEKFRLMCANIVVVAARVRPQNVASSPSAPEFTLPKTTNCVTTYGTNEVHYLLTRGTT